jgi:hypothetical protein
MRHKRSLLRALHGQGSLLKPQLQQHYLLLLEKELEPLPWLQRPWRVAPHEASCPSCPSSAPHAAPPSAHGGELRGAERPGAGWHTWAPVARGRAPCSSAPARPTRRPSPHPPRCLGAPVTRAAASPPARRRACATHLAWRRGGGLPRPQEDGSSISQRAARTHLAGFSLLAAAPHCLLARLFLLRLLHLKLRLRAARPERACRCAGVLDFEGIQTDFIPGSVNRLFLEEAGPTWSRWCCISLGSRFLTHAASRRTESLNSRRPAPRAFWFSFSIARFTCPRRTAAQPRAGPLIPFILLLARSETVDRGDQECVVQGRWPRDAPGSPRDPSGFGWGDACRFGASFGLYLSHHAKARRVEKDS